MSTDMLRRLTNCRFIIIIIIITQAAAVDTFWQGRHLHSSKNSDSARRSEFCYRLGLGR